MRDLLPRHGGKSDRERKIGIKLWVAFQGFLELGPMNGARVFLSSLIDIVAGLVQALFHVPVHLSRDQQALYFIKLIRLSRDRILCCSPQTVRYLLDHSTKLSELLLSVIGDFHARLHFDPGFIQQRRHIEHEAQDDVADISLVEFAVAVKVVHAESHARLLLRLANLRECREQVRKLIEGQLALAVRCTRNRTRQLAVSVWRQ